MVYVLQQDNVLKEMVKMPDKIKEEEIDSFVGDDDHGNSYLVKVYRKLRWVTTFGRSKWHPVGVKYMRCNENTVYKTKDDNTYYMVVSQEKIIIRRK